MKTSTLTHADLVTIAERFGRDELQCRRWLTEPMKRMGLRISGESPDFIGWKTCDSCHVVECKVSEADFRADAQKPHRISPARGLGSHRWYMMPQYLVEPFQIPECYGLLYVTEGGAVTIVQDAPRLRLRDVEGELGLALTAWGAAERAGGQANDARPANRGHTAARFHDPIRAYVAEHPGCRLLDVVREILAGEYPKTSNTALANRLRSDIQSGYLKGVVADGPPTTLRLSE